MQAAGLSTIPGLRIAGGTIVFQLSGCDGRPRPSALSQGTPVAPMYFPLNAPFCFLSSVSKYLLAMPSLRHDGGLSSPTALE